MKRLSREAFERARAFLKSEARPLDRALFEHEFEGAPGERAIEELARYQNPDGGFGRALEPDLRKFLRIEGAPQEPRRDRPRKSRRTASCHP